MGIQSVGFPNLFTINAASVGNFVRAAEPLVEWISDCVAYVRDNGYHCIQPTQQSEEEWTQHMIEGWQEHIADTGQQLVRGGQHPRQGALPADGSRHRAGDCGPSGPKLRATDTRASAWSRLGGTGIRHPQKPARGGISSAPRQLQK